VWAEDMRKKVQSFTIVRDSFQEFVSGHCTDNSKRVYAYSCVTDVRLLDLDQAESEAEVRSLL
jgi:hypothetical protein